MRGTGAAEALKIGSVPNTIRKRGIEDEQIFTMPRLPWCRPGDLREGGCGLRDL